MKFYQPIHRLLQDTPQFEFIGTAQFPDHVPEPIGHTTYKMYRQFPAFPVFAQMLEEKIIQPVLNDILDHIMPAVFHQEERKRSEITVGQRLFVHIFQYLLPVRDVFGVELIPQILVKSIIKIVLQHFFAQVGAATLISEDVAKSRAALRHLFPVKITGKAARTQVTRDSL